MPSNGEILKIFILKKKKNLQCCNIIRSYTVYNLIQTLVISFSPKKKKKNPLLYHVQLLYVLTLLQSKYYKTKDVHTRNAHNLLYMCMIQQNICIIQQHNNWISIVYLTFHSHYHLKQNSQHIYKNKLLRKVNECSKNIDLNIYFF